MIKVLGARCIVKEDKLEEKTSSGLIIPGRDKVPTNRGVIVGVGDGAMLDDGTKVPMPVKEGDTVVYANFAGSPIEVDGVVYIILNERDILCVVE